MYIKGLKKPNGSVVRLRQFSGVAMLNKLQIHNASNAAYFPDYKYSSYVAELWGQERNKLTDHRGAVVQAPGVSHDGEPKGEIIQTFDRQLPLIPNLSFLQHSEARADSHHELSRDEVYA